MQHDARRQTVFQSLSDCQYRFLSRTYGQGVQGGRQDGPDTRQGTGAHIQEGRKILCRARHYCPVLSYRTSIPESCRGSMKRAQTYNESFHTLCRQGRTSGSSV